MSQLPNQYVLKVVFPQSWSKQYDYLSSTPIDPGTLVQAPVKNKLCLGVVWDISPALTDSVANIKTIESALTIKMPKPFLLFLLSCALHNHVLEGAFLKLAMRTLKLDIEQPYLLAEDNSVLTIEELNTLFSHAKWKKMLRDGKLKPVAFSNVVHGETFPYLTDDQKEAVSQIKNLSGTYQTCLVEGQTGSGKTEVYLEAIYELSKTKQVLILLPEISLTNAFLHRFEKRFGVKPLVWHSMSSTTSKDAIWLWAANEKESGVLVGARSALFVPFGNLGMVVMDEEHDSSYKQSEGLRYHSKQAVKSLCKIFQAPAVFISATPSFEHKVEVPNLHIKLNRGPKYGQATVEIVDMKAEQGSLSNTVISYLGENLSKKQLSLLFLNRKGFAPIVLCKRCNKRLECANCSVGMVYYRGGQARCHYCDYKITLDPLCACGNKLSLFGLGIEKVEEQVRKLFPSAKVVTISAALGKQEMQDLHASIHNHEIDILIGTQVIAQGHHIDNLTFTAVLDCDFSLSSPSYKAAESTYQLLTQVKGRCGRGEIPGVCVLQTHFPDHPLLRKIANGTEIEQWKETELGNRKNFKWPPYSKLIGILISSYDLKQATAYAAKIAMEANAIIKQTMCMGVQVLGPAPPMQINKVFKVRLLIRYAFLDQTTQEVLVLEEILSFIKKQNTGSKVQIVIDVDPEQFM